MATETVSSDQSTPTLEQVEKEVKEEIKINKEETVSPCKESEEKPKDEDTPSATTVPLAEPIEKIEEKQSEPPIVEEVVKADVEEKPKIEEPPSLPVTSAEPEGKIEDKQIEPPAAEEIKKPDDLSILDASSTDNQEIAKDFVPVDVSRVVDDTIKSEPEVAEVKNLETPQEEPATELQEEPPKKIDIPESVIEAVEGKEEQVDEIPKKIDIPESVSEAIKTKEEQVEEASKKFDIPESATKAIETKEEEVNELAEKIDIPETAIEAVETKVAQVEELPKKIDIPESVREAIETKEEQEEELPPKEQKAAVGEAAEVSAAEPKKGGVSTPVPEVVDKPEEKLESTKQIKKEAAVVEPEEKNEVEPIKDRESPTDEICDAKLVEGVEAATVESTATESSEPVASTLVEAKDDSENIEVPPAEVTEKTEDKEKESTAKPEAEVPLEETLEKSEKEIEAKDLKTEANEEKVGTVELTQPEAKEVDPVTSSISTFEDTGKVVEAETTSRDIKLPADIGNKTDETAASVETEKVAEVEKKVDVEELQKHESETKEEEAVEAVETQLEQESKEVDNLKPTQDAPKEKVPGKTTQKSNNILSKMKHSLVKAKKAIIGKSQSKTPPPPPSETKNEVQS